MAGSHSPRMAIQRSDGIARMSSTTWLPTQQSRSCAGDRVASQRSEVGMGKGYEAITRPLATRRITDG